MTFALGAAQCQNPAVSFHREWMLANGIGGFAMGTVAGVMTRRYHGLLVAAIEPPADRMVLLAAMEEFVQTDGQPVGLSNNQYPGTIYPEGYLLLQSFSVNGDAEWIFKAGNARIQKKIAVTQGKNVTTLEYKNVGEHPVRLTLRPLVCHKPYHQEFTEQPGYPESLSFDKAVTVVSHVNVRLSISHPGGRRQPVQGWYYRFEHAREEERGLAHRDDLYCPCELQYELDPGESCQITASAGDPVRPRAIESAGIVHKTLGQVLKYSAERFIVHAPTRDTIIAGYPWFTDWGRDTMIALPGLCLHTDRVDLARKIISSYAERMNQGLIPNRFVEDGGEPAYNTVDATLWMAVASYRTLQAEWNERFAKKTFAALKDSFDWHVKGTMFGIRVDPQDGLLTQGVGNEQLTWMDAKIGDWVVTPRHGKPVEICALWCNFCRTLEWLAGKLGEDSAPFVAAADKAESNFDKRFWSESRGFYMDTVDPDDASLRPNQVIAMSLPFSVATGDHAKAALDVVTRELLTPKGLRTLGPDEPGYLRRYEGDLLHLDSAYHQGTVWPWLLGPYCTALVRLAGDRKEAKRILSEAREMLQENGQVGIAEVYDAEAPQRPSGCPWQAWSIAEILRSWIEDAKGD